MLNSNLLQAQMKLNGIGSKDYAKAQKWSMSTAYRKINGESAHTAPEIQVAVEVLNLSTSVASEIFFASNLS